MRIIHRGRQTGKTEELLRRCMDDPKGVFVCATKEECCRIWKRCADMMSSPPPVVSLHELKNARYRDQMNLYIDDVEHILAVVLGRVHIPAWSVISSETERESEARNTAGRNNA